MEAQELNLEKVLELAPELKDYKLNSVFLVYGQLNTVSESQFPFELMELAEAKILKAVKDGYFCDAIDDGCDCSEICTFMKGDDCESCDFMKSFDDVDNELNIDEMLYDENIFETYESVSGLNFKPNDDFIFLASGSLITSFVKKQDGRFVAQTYAGHAVDMKNYKELRMVTQTTGVNC